MLGMLLVALEDLEPGLQQAFQLGVLGGRDQQVSSAPLTVLW